LSAQSLHWKHQILRQDYLGTQVLKDGSGVCFLHLQDPGGFQKILEMMMVTTELIELVV
jgi:hypothetical protein